MENFILFTFISFPFPFQAVKKTVDFCKDIGLEMKTSNIFYSNIIRQLLYELSGGKDINIGDPKIRNKPEISSKEKKKLI